MKVQEIAHHERLRPQKLSARETPHATIEPNTTCNIRCAYCYCIEEAAVKTFAEVKAEIDLARARRNLDTISLLGGEPTLHPNIVDIVRYVKSQGLVCILLTNGVRFLRDGDDDLLDALVSAGVDRFLVHIDSGQRHVHHDIDRARHDMFSKLDARRVCYGLSLTLYKGQEHEIARSVREFARHPYFDGILCTLAFDLDHAFDAEPNPLMPRPKMSSVYRAIGDDLKVEPSAYLPSSLDDEEVTWLMYFYFFDAETGASFAVSPELNRALKTLFRKARGHHFFGETMPPSRVPAALLATAAAELSLRPSRLAELLRFLRGLRGTSTLRFLYVVVQQAPLFDAARNKVQICWQCPDATVRNGKLTPVCIAGRVNPLGGRPMTAPREVVDEIFRHLGEQP